MKCINDKIIKQINNINGGYHDSSDKKNICSPDLVPLSKWMWDDDSTTNPAGVELILNKNNGISKIAFFAYEKTMYEVKIFVNDIEIFKADVIQPDKYTMVNNPIKGNIEKIKILRYHNSDCGINKILLFEDDGKIYNVDNPEYTTPKENAMYNLLNIDNKLYSIKEKYFDNAMQQYIPIDIDVDKVTRQDILKHGFIDIKNIVLPHKYSKNILTTNMKYAVSPYNITKIISKDKSIKLGSSISDTLPITSDRDNITAEFWINTDKTDKKIFSFGNYALVIKDGKIGFTTGNEDYYYNDFKYFDKWIHVSAIFTASGYDSIYINGENLKLTQTKEPGLKSIERRFTLGDNKLQSEGKLLMYGLKVWDENRTENEASKDMILTSSEDIYNKKLLGYYKLNSTDENKFIDDSSYRNNIIIRTSHISIADDSPILNKFLFRINNKLYNIKNNKLNYIGDHQTEEYTKNIIEEKGIINYNIFDHELLSRYRNVELLLSLKSDNSNIYVDSKIFKPIDKLKQIGSGQAKIMFTKPISSPSIVDLEILDPYQKKYDINKDKNVTNAIDEEYKKTVKAETSYNDNVAKYYKNKIEDDEIKENILKEYNKEINNEQLYEQKLADHYSTLPDDILHEQQKEKPKEVIEEKPKPVVTVEELNKQKKSLEEALITCDEGQTESLQQSLKDVQAKIDSITKTFKQEEKIKDIEDSKIKQDSNTVQDAIDKINNFSLNKEPDTINVKEYIQALIDNAYINVNVHREKDNEFAVTLSNNEVAVTKHITVTRKDGVSE